MASVNLRKPVGIVCGSGIDLLPLLDAVESVKAFSEYPQLLRPNVDGHQGEFVFGSRDDVPIVLQCGRLHFYEGYRYEQVVRPVDILREIGVEKILFTNAVGGLNPAMRPGDLCAVDAVTLWPCTQWSGPPRRLQTPIVLDHCQWQGRYAWVHGPTYETHAEIAALQSMDCDVVGMSAAPELHRCRDLGLQAAIVSCITNNCHASEILTHDHVIDQARKVTTDLIQVVMAFVSA